MERAIMKKAVMIIMMFAIVIPGISGCANIRDDKERTQTEGALAGAGTGAVIGALLGGLLGNGEGAAIGAAIGAAAGGAAGYAYGTHVAAEKGKYAKTEDWLDACIASLEETNQETKQYNAQLTKDIADLDTQTAQLKAGYKNKKISKAAMQEEKKKVDFKLAEAKEKLKRANFELENQEKVLAEAKKSAEGQDGIAKKLDSQIASLKKHIGELERNTEELASLSSRMAV